jgi:hypothetical protein
MKSSKVVDKERIIELMMKESVKILEREENEMNPASRRISKKQGD